MKIDRFCHVPSVDVVFDCVYVARLVLGKVERGLSSNIKNMLAKR